MLAHLFFLLVIGGALGMLTWSFLRIYRNIKLLKNPYPIKEIGTRLKMLWDVAILQKKIMRFPIVGFIHAMVFWGFLMVTFGTVEMFLDGTLGVVFDDSFENDRVLGFLGPLYTLMMALGDVFAYVILAFVLVFLVRRASKGVQRFTGVEMRHKDHLDAAISLIFIIFLMVSLIGLNLSYLAYAEALGKTPEGAYPISGLLFGILPESWGPEGFHRLEMASWWLHVGLVFAFMNYLPYSKHFHVFMALPNVFLAKTGPITRMSTMESVKKEVLLMMNPDAPAPTEEEAAPERFGMKDVQDGSWKNYIDSLTCTQCGRCTSVCPANNTGKLLSPRKIILDYRRRMEEKQDGLQKNGKDYDDGKSLYGDYITKEEIWACTTCHACVQECPVNIDHVSIIMDLRRYVYLEESDAPSSINAMNTNLENNGAPWQYSPSDRFNWADELYIADKQTA